MRDIDIAHHVNQGVFEYYYSDTHLPAPIEAAQETPRSRLHYVDLRHSLDIGKNGLYGRYSSKA